MRRLTCISVSLNGNIKVMWKDLRLPLAPAQAVNEVQLQLAALDV